MLLFWTKVQLVSLLTIAATYLFFFFDCIWKTMYLWLYLLIAFLTIILEKVLLSAFWMVRQLFLYFSSFRTLFDIFAFSMRTTEGLLIQDSIFCWKSYRRLKIFDKALVNSESNPPTLSKHCESWHALKKSTAYRNRRNTTFSFCWEVMRVARNLCRT